MFTKHADLLQFNLFSSFAHLFFVYSSDWIAKIAFFNAENHEERNAFVTALATSLEALAYSPNEVIFQKGDAATKFYLIGRGIVGTEGRIRKKEDFFGTDMIAGLILKDPRRITSARSLTFIDVNVLTLEALEEILDSGDFEETTKLIRKAALRVALRRTVLEMSRQYRYICYLIELNSSKKNYVVYSP